MLHQSAGSALYLGKEADMTAVRAVYDGKVFIPEKPCEITSGSEVTLTIETVNLAISEKQKKIAAFRQLTQEVNELTRTDPLPPEFDAILTQRVRFRELTGT
jgi:predicted DNA-binding antitoxin AbrB/MazE fold protein